MSNAQARAHVGAGGFSSTKSTHDCVQVQLLLTTLQWWTCPPSVRTVGAGGADADARPGGADAVADGPVATLVFDAEVDGAEPVFELELRAVADGAELLERDAPQAAATAIQRAKASRPRPRERFVRASIGSK